MGKLGVIKMVPPKIAPIPSVAKIILVISPFLNFLIF